MSDSVSGITLAPSTSSGVLGTSHTVTATVSPTQSGVIVRFRVIAGPNSGDAGVASTNLGGQAAFTYLGNGGTGTDTIIAWADLDTDGVRDGDEPQTAATRLWTSGPVGGVSVDPSTDIVEVGEQHTVRATVSPAETGLTMRFAVTSGPNAGKLGVALTNSSGRATYTYVGTGGTGLDVILAWVDLDGNLSAGAHEPQGQATVQWGSGPIAPAITAAPLTATNLVGSFHTVTATISPVEAGEVVRFRVISGPHAGANGRVLTNASGQAAYSYLGSVAGTDSIRVWVDLDDDGVLDGIEARTSVTKIWTTSAVPQSIALTPSSNVSLLGTAHTMTATVGPAQSGTIVRFWVTAGPNKGDTGVAVTNSLGRATFSYLGNGGSGSDVIISWADINNNGVRGSSEPQASAVQSWTTAPVSGISIAPASSAGSVNTQHLVTATVSPQAAGVLGRFRVTEGPNANDSGADLTNSLGRATFSYLGNGGVGADLILAWSDLDNDGVVDANEPRAVAIRSWTAVAGSAFALSPSNDTNPVGTRHSMTGTVSPAQKNLLVRFKVTGGPNDGTHGSDDTNSSGIANLSYVGDGGLGTDVILAWIDFDRDGRVDSGEPQAIATKQWTALSVAGLSLTPDFDQERTGKDHKVTAQLNPQVQGVRIRFEVIAGPNQGETGRDRTDDHGRATFKYKGDSGVGTDLILAWADVDDDGVLDPGEHQASALVEWLAGFNDEDSLVAEVCDNLDKHSHPSLKTLCRLVESGKLSEHAEQVIIGVILKQAGFDHVHHGRWFRDDHDDDHDHDDDDD